MPFLEKIQLNSINDFNALFANANVADASIQKLLANKWTHWVIYKGSKNNRVGLISLSNNKTLKHSTYLNLFLYNFIDEQIFGIILNKLNELITEINKYCTCVYVLQLLEGIPVFNKLKSKDEHITLTKSIDYKQWVSIKLQQNERIICTLNAMEADNSLYTFFKSCFEHNKNPIDIKNILPIYYDKDYRTEIKYWKGDILVGVCIGYLHSPNLFHVFLMGVLPAYRNQGIGTMLLTKLEKFNVINNYALGIYRGEKAAYSLYTNFGYKFKKVNSIITPFPLQMNTDI